MTKKKQKAIKPILGSYLKRNSFSKWVVSHLPENYKELMYVDPYCGGLNVLLNKDKSHIEIVNGSDNLILEIYRSLRNEPKEFISKISRYKFCEDTFQRIKKLCECKEDYIDLAIYEFALRSMSKAELKLVFSKVGSKSWKGSIKSLPFFASRIKEVFIINCNPLNMIKDFSFKETILFCDPPHLYETKKGKTVYDSEISVEEHINLSHALNSFKGKVILTGVSSPLYNRLYKNWNICKSKYKNKLGKYEIIWKNY
jgi:DNA adenine methylase